MIISLIIIAFPLILVLGAADKKMALYKGIMALIGLHLCVGLVTQAVGIFDRQVLMALFIAIDIAALAVFFTTFFATWRKGDKHSSLRSSATQIFHKINLKKFFVNIFVFFVACLVFFQLYSVHFNYSGSVATIGGSETVSHMTYAYPYFSDEWIGAAYANKAIQSGHIVLTNPLTEKGSVVNFILPYLSFLSELFLALGLNPVSQFAYLSLLMNLLLLATFYSFIREQKVSAPVSALATFAVMSVTNGANIPGLWYLLPLTAGMIPFFVGLIFQGRNKPSWAFFSYALAFLLYPPMIVFIVPSALCMPIFRRAYADRKTLRTILFAFCIFVAIALAIFLLAVVSKGISIGLASYALSSILFRDITAELYPHLTLFTLMPWPIAIVALFSLPYLYKKKNILLLVPICTGLLLWACTALSKKEFVISYARIATVTSFLLVAAAGFLVEYVYVRALKIMSDGDQGDGSGKNENNKEKAGKGEKILLGIFVSLCVCGVLIFLTFSYTANDGWNQVTGRVVGTGASSYGDAYQNLLPAAPANNYLNPDDLRLFQNIHGTRFVAPSWKGLVIDVATGNYAMETKAATFLVNTLPYNNFIAASCASKMKLSKQYTIRYYYGAPISCPGFSLVGASSEGLSLYKINLSFLDAKYADHES